MSAVEPLTETQRAEEDAAAGALVLAVAARRSAVRAAARSVTRSPAPTSTRPSAWRRAMLHRRAPR